MGLVILIPGTLSPKPPESPWKVLRVDFSRDEVTAETLVQQVFAYLSCCFELLEYASYHRSFPSLSAALLAPASTEASRAQILQQAKAEWNTVLDMEKTTAGQLLLKRHCLFTTFQSFRELHSVCERHGYKFGEPIREVVKAWLPAFGQSSNLEKHLSANLKVLFGNPVLRKIH